MAKLLFQHKNHRKVSIALNSVIALVVCFTVSLVMKYTPILNMKSDATLEPNKAYEGKVATIIIPKDTPKQQLYRLSPISVLFKLVIGFVLPYGFLFSNLIWLEISALARALLWACIVAYTVGFVIYIIFCIMHYNRKTKRLINFACCSLWTSHLAMVLVLMVGFVAAHNISLYRRRIGIMYIIISHFN